MYGRQTKNAIAIMSRLAEAYDEDIALAASSIAETRRLAQPTVAKILSTLAVAGLVTGKTGPGGGFRLARHPRDITIYEVFVLFEREEESETQCPFGGGICGGDDPCPLHDRLAAVWEALDELLHDTTFDVFRAARRHKRTGRRR
ncbi:MAG: RrF2 family transcriptional regulator [Planctomycetota bacterium]|jgi:Rrf2 family protein